MSLIIKTSVRKAIERLKTRHKVYVKFSTLTFTETEIIIQLFSCIDINILLVCSVEIANFMDRV